MKLCTLSLRSLVYRCAPFPLALYTQSGGPILNGHQYSRNALKHTYIRVYSECFNMWVVIETPSLYTSISKLYG